MQGLTHTDQELDSGADDSLGDSFLRAVMQSTQPQSEPLSLPMPMPGERLGGRDGKRYELHRVLGQGSMGTVFQAFDHELQRMVALKFLLPQKGEMEIPPLLQEEAKAIARLDHENIVRIHDVSEWNVTLEPNDESSLTSIPFLVMEHLEGMSLSSLLKRERPRLQRALEIALDLAAGLAHAHERHLVHGDIKPGNVRILANGRAKLLDFGLARLTTLSRPASRRDTAGTPAYMSPEQWKGEPPDVRSDVWAAGIILFELLTGEHPFPREGPDALRARVTSAEPMPGVRERRPELPEEAARLVAAALAKAPRERIPDGTELLHQLRALQEHLAAQRRRPGAPQWRQVTMISCELAPSEDPRLSLDPEDFGELEAAFHHACSRIVRQYGGLISTCVGAEVLACLGHPVTREDDSEQAVHLALRLVEELPGELGKLSRTRLAVRAGVHTGQVVIADVTPEPHGMTPAMQGEAPRIASWLASQAAPNTVLISAQTRALVRGSFQAEPLGRRSLTGPRGPLDVELFRILAARSTVFRFDRALVAGELTPLVGREHALRHLARLCDEGRRGQGRFILLRGEAGIGKSRLIQELHNREDCDECIWLRCQCWPQFKSSAFYPLIDWLQRFIPLAPGQPSEQKLGRLETRMAELGLPPEYVHPLASLLSLPIPESAPFARLGPERQRELRVGALMALLERLAARQPLILVLEDVHWADPSTLQFLDFLLDHLAGTRASILLTSRPELEHTWKEHPLFHELELEHLTPERTEALIREVSGGRDLPEQTVRQLKDRTDGIPLFVEEMTRTVLEQGGADGDFAKAGSLIPATLNEMLLARLDALPPQRKSLVQIAAVLGREFSEELLRAVSFLGEDALRRELEQLEKARLLRRQGQPPDVTYAFKHALIQDAAYQSLLRSTRRRYHGRVVQVLMEQFPDEAESHPELLAQHHAGAGNPDQAAEQWRRAGERATEKSAFAEASHHFTKALEQLSSLPPSHERDRREIVLRVGLGFALVSLKGYAAKEVDEVYSRAFELCEQLGGDVPLPVLWGMNSVAVVRGEREASDRYLAIHLRLVERSTDSLVLIQAHAALSSQCFWRGDYAGALWHSSQALECVTKYGASRFMQAGFGTDRRHIYEQVLFAYMYHTASDFVCGKNRRSKAFSDEALALAEATGQPYLIALVLAFTSSRAYEQGLLELAREQATRLLELALTNKFLFFQATGNCVLGGVLAGLGDVRSGTERLREGLGMFHSMGAMLAYSYHLGMLACAYLLGGRIEEGLAIVREGLELSETSMMRRHLPGLMLVQGELLLQRGEVEQARSSMEQARAMARHDGARRYALRASLRLASLPRQGVSTLSEGTPLSR